MNSSAARSKRSRSAAGWLAVGTPASSDAARMRTPRIGSVRSGETSGQRCAAARWPACRARRCAPSGRDRSSRCAPDRCSTGETREASSVSAPARAIAGAWRSAATAASSAAASPASRPRCVQRLGVVLEALAVRAVPALDGGGRPLRRSCRCGSRCRRWACRVCRTDQGAECGSYDRAADRPPCRCARACGTRRSRAAGFASSWRWCAPTHTCRRRGIAGRRRRPTREAWRHAARGNRCR